MRTPRSDFHLLAVLLVLSIASPLFSQTSGGPKQGAVERIKIHAKSLEGNLEGDSPDREVLIYLPASYRTSANRRYPVVYMLHGFTDNPDNWWGFKQHFINLPAVLNKAFSDGSTREVMLVMPDSFTAYQGSMYSNSVTTGDWEDFVAKELVAYIDAHYRTIANAASRGLSGHSMGGYGAIKIGMRHPDVYSSVYVLSPCCMSAPNPQSAGRGGARAEAVHSKDEVAKADFGTKAVLAEAAAWSPNAKNPPLYFDLPTKDGQYQADVGARWAANAPLAMVYQYISNLRRLHALAIDVGEQDGLSRDAKLFDSILTDFNVPHVFETYQGDHTNHVADRVEMKVIPFFSKNLSFEQPKR
jgi:S-formylglutathione hydrolase